MTSIHSGLLILSLLVSQVSTASTPGMRDGPLSGLTIGEASWKLATMPHRCTEVSAGPTPTSICAWAIYERLLWSLQLEKMFEANAPFEVVCFVSDVEGAMLVGRCGVFGDEVAPSPPPPGWRSESYRNYRARQEQLVLQQIRDLRTAKTLEQLVVHIGTGPRQCEFHRDGRLDVCEWHIHSEQPGYELLARPLNLAARKKLRVLCRIRGADDESPSQPCRVSLLD